LLTDQEREFESLRQNLVVIGRDRTEDRRESLVGYSKPLSRADLLTRAIAIIQSGRYIEWWPQWARLLSVAAIVVFALVVFRGSRAKVIFWGLIGAFLWFGVSMMVFKSTLAWSPPFAPLALFALLLVIGIILPQPKAKTAEGKG